jgi:hypothetical protein
VRKRGPPMLTRKDQQDRPTGYPAVRCLRNTLTTRRCPEPKRPEDEEVPARPARARLRDRLTAARSSCCAMRTGTLRDRL